MTKVDFASLIQQLPAGQIDIGQIHTDLAERQFFSADVFTQAEPCLAVFKPQSIGDLQQMIGFCAQHQLYMIARGGGLSYTDAYLPKDSARTVLIDMRALNRIVEINSKDGYVIVEAGVTWAQLYQALQVQKLRTPYFGPLSGLQATIGGTLSQGSIFLGSGRFGSVGDSVLAIEALSADGTLLRTGSWAADDRTAPFIRYFGPDLTGMLIGDAGSLGFKTQVCLKLIPSFNAIDFLSYECADFASLSQAMAAVAQTGLASECFAFDPVLAEIRMQRMSLMSDVKALGQVLKQQGLLSGLKVVTAGRSFVDTQKYSFHISVEAYSDAELKANLQSLRALVKAQGTCKEIDNTIPKVMRSQPFVPPNTMLGPNGERWVPVHGILPHSAVLTCFAKLQSYFANHAQQMQRLSVKNGYLMSTVAAQGFLLEPCFYWFDEQQNYHRQMVEANYLERVPRHPANPEARALVAELKRGAADCLRDCGASHFQLGKFYRYRAGRNALALRVQDAIKAELDPHGLINPGVLC